MKILRLLNKKHLSIILIFFLVEINSNAQDQPVDIWNLNKEKTNNLSVDNISLSENENEDQTNGSNIYNMQSQKDTDTIKVDEEFDTKKLKIIGLYDPQDYNLKIDMWSYSNGDQLKYLFSNLAKLDLSKDASELMNILLLINSYYPKKNITENEFLKVRSDWLIKNKDLDLIEEYLIKNQIINNHPKLSRYLIDQYLSESNVAKACRIFSKNIEPINDEYLSKFNIYCLINDGKNEEAQLILDLKKELGFKDLYFENKLEYLFGYTNKTNKDISEDSILNFHLAHRTNPEFSFDPRDNTNKLIWRYLATSNLLYNISEIDITEMDKISLIEKAVHDKNYSEEDLFELYKKFQFNINQLLNSLDTYKTLSNVEARALIYQRILLESEINKKLELIKTLKNLFIKDGFTDAFDKKLQQFLAEIDANEVPSNYTSFYYTYLKNKEQPEIKIKYNNDLLYQSKLINYFNGDYAKSKIEKEINSYLKKIKKNKKYKISKKDIIVIESLKSDGIKISKKYDDLYKVNESEIPTDIQVMINNNEVGAAVLRIIEVIGEDKIESLDEDTIYFIINTLNQLDIDFIRNKILLKVLPLKV